jgi:hypothetical protein
VGGDATAAADKPDDISENLEWKKEIAGCFLIFLQDRFPANYLWHLNSNETMGEFFQLEVLPNASPPLADSVGIECKRWKLCDSFGGADRIRRIRVLISQK